jgi:hypothetical protein
MEWQESAVCVKRVDTTAEPVLKPIQRLPRKERGETTAAVESAEAALSAAPKATMSEPAPYATLTEFKKSDGHEAVLGFVVSAVLLATMSGPVSWLILKPLQ